jgi:hypothetical protein
VEGGLSSLVVAYCVLEVMMKVMRCVLLCILQALEGGLDLLEAPEVLKFWSFLELPGASGGDAPCAALYTRGCGRWAQFAGGAGVSRSFWR